MSDSRRLRVVRLMWIFSVACGLVPAVLLGMKNPVWLAGAALLAGGGVAGWMVAGWMARAGMGTGWLASLALLNLLTVCPELALRAGGFRYESGVEFGYPRPSELVDFVPDEKLFWKLPAGTKKTNSLGFPGREVAVPKPEGAFRLLFIGDSCTWQGYPWEVERLLRSRGSESGSSFEAVVLAVPGYSSYQGRVLAETYCEEFDADVVFVFFGWNDHWQAYGDSDADKALATEGGLPGWPGKMHRVAQHFRVAQCLAWVVGGLGEEGGVSAALRVPIASYRENLIRIGEVCGEGGVPIILITAPSGHEQAGVPKRLLELGFAADEESVLRLHGEYNEAVRRVSARRRWYLLDLERRYGRRDDLDEVFMEDGIHFEDAWLPRVASEMVDFLVLHELVSF